MRELPPAVIALGAFLLLAGFLAWGAWRFAVVPGGRDLAFGFATFAVLSVVAGVSWAMRLSDMSGPRRPT